jgi:hypothetical protein
MVRREQDISLLNRIANDDAVRPFIKPDGSEIDFSPIDGLRAGEMGGVVLSNGEDAIGVFEMTAPGSYQVHTMFGPTCRGRRAIETAREMLAWMWEHNASVVWGATPRWNKPACLFNRMVGAREIDGDEFEAIFEYRKAS